MKRTTRGEKLLDALVENPSHPLTEDGKNFLIQTLDPNHDRPFKKVGWVDNNTRPSVLRAVKQAMAISAVSGGGAAVAAPWDCHIAISPYTSGGPMSAVSSRSNAALALGNGGNIVPFTGLRAIAQFNSGANVVWPTTLTSPAYLGGMSVDPNYLKSDTRLVGIAFEVTDTSAEINKQGILTSYSYPQDGPLDYYAAIAPGGNATLNFNGFTGRRIIYPPNSVQDAMLLPDTKQWEAKFGSYSVPTFQNIHNPPTSNTSVVPVFEDSLTTFDVNATTTAICYLSDFSNVKTTTSSTPTVNLNVGAPSYSHFFPINTSGVILSGLNPNSTFNVSMTYIMEEIPTLSDKASVVLTQPPPSFDPFALEMYTRIAARLPPAVFVSENDDGNWFWSIVEDIAEMAAPILGFIPHPIAQGVGLLANGININKRQRNERNAVVKPKPLPPPKPQVRKAKPLPPIPAKKKPLPPVPRRK